MRPRILHTVLFTALFVILSGCGSVPNCPTCGTTTNGAYAIIDVIPVPEHNSAGEPGGPFNHERRDAIVVGSEGSASRKERGGPPAVPATVDLRTRIERGRCRSEPSGNTVHAAQLPGRTRAPGAKPGPGSRDDRGVGHS